MKIKIKVASLDDSVDIIRDFYFQEEKEVHPTKKHLFGYYPELLEINKDLPIEEKNKQIYKIVEKKYNETLEKMNTKAQKYNEIWSKYNDSFINELSKYLNTSWHDFKDEIIGYLAPIPIFPRFPNELTFYFSPFITNEKFIEVVAHECTHFLWFKKVSELYNKPYNKCSHEEWEYSELVVDPILNSPEMKKVFVLNEKAYDYFYTQEYNGENIMSHIKNIYQKDIPIEEKIVEGFNYYLNYYNNKKDKYK